MRNVAKDHWWQIGPPSKPVSKSPEHRCRPFDTRSLPSQSSQSKQKKKHGKITGFPPWKMNSRLGVHHFLQFFFFFDFFVEDLFILSFFSWVICWFRPLIFQGVWNFACTAQSHKAKVGSELFADFVFLLGSETQQGCTEYSTANISICLDDQKKST